MNLRFLLAVVCVGFAIPVCASEDTITTALVRLQQHIEGTSSLSPEELAQGRSLIEQNAGELGADSKTMAKAFAVVELYEQKAGPLFLNPKTKNGFPRKPSPDLQLEHTMLALQQALLDNAYTSANLKKYRRMMDGTFFKTSVYFPGAVGKASSGKGIHSALINASHPKAVGSPVAGADGAARRPTGWYLVPGQIAEVAVPPTMVNKGYSIRVGAHSWDLSKKKTIERIDRVSLVYPITEARTLIANPLGGGVYIEVPYQANLGTVKVWVKNAARAPFFSMTSTHSTTLAEWNRTEKRWPGPWADFETDKFMMQVPTAWLNKLNNPVKLMQDWDKAMDAVSELFGHPLVRSKTVLYLQADVAMRGNANFPGYPQSNYPYNAYQPEQCRHPWMLKGPQFADWTVFHEVGHSQFCSKFRGETEALVNLPHVAIMNRKFGFSLDEAFGSSVNKMNHLTMDEVAVMWMVTENFRNGKPMNISNKPGDEVKYQHRGYGKYVEIANLFGWDALSRFWQEENASWKPGDRVPNNSDPTDVRILRLSKAAGADLTPLIHFWGVQPERPQVLARMMRREGLQPSKEIHDRLLHYKTLIPMDNAAFRQHLKRVYPKGLGKLTNPLYGTGWYRATAATYSEADGEAAQQAMQKLIEHYFGRQSGAS
ncbi:MAG: M60 family metallopeptidase [Rhodopirellula sp. JB044]|uniref:M60 family metallopeptidase n=1 Tax=Rhodopirellula sp. JB044 TaxID=3342844 RepID=UPI00370BEF66